MPTWKDIFQGEPWPSRSGRKRKECHFCRKVKQNLQPMDIVRKGYKKTQTRYYYLCCVQCWNERSFVVYEP